jgi:hypothetical protein
MSSEKWEGLRCRARTEIRTHVGRIAAFTEGVIVSETDNLGRHLLMVEWENGLCAYAFPNDIEIIDGDVAGQ